MKKYLAIILFILIISGLLLCGCSAKDTSENDAQQVGAAQEVENGKTEDADDGYIDRADAVAQVKVLSGSGANFVSAEKGYTNDGKKAWIVKVEPITSTPEYVIHTYYVGEDFCYYE